ncbi:iron-SULFUR flavoprotein [Lachnospiraceae bacterium KM106-2]|nr:iron-SULFUR flavoprotein [Lachnospiraceae bacterium KM106-2]
MRLMIINCSPRMVKRSNTDQIIRKFLEGFEQNDNTAEVYELSKRRTWDVIRSAYDKHSHILMAMPLFVENVPGILLEFLETLKPKQDKDGEEKTQISFLLQGGFAEASQLRCGEKYLETLPGYFNCEYAGTLIKGGMFGVHMVDEKQRDKMLQPFVQMGAYFAENKKFDKAVVTEFAKPEYFPKAVIALFPIINLSEKRFMKKVAKGRGCKESLLAKPYQEYIR